MGKTAASCPTPIRICYQKKSPITCMYASIAELVLWECFDADIFPLLQHKYFCLAQRPKVLAEISEGLLAT